MNKAIAYNSNSFNDPRQLYRFDVIRYVDKQVTDDHVEKAKEYLGWSMSLWADTRRDAIKRFIAMTTPVTRFDITCISHPEAYPKGWSSERSSSSADARLVEAGEEIAA